MAAAGNTANSGGSQSPTSSSRNESTFDEAQNTGCLNLSGRKLKDFPHCASKYDLSDTVSADLSKNRFVEVPREVCGYESLEQLSCYHNVLKTLPEPLGQLQALVHLNLGRNQLTVLPSFLCNLPSLEVLLAANNKLVSLPEEIGKLDKLMELDVSCNEITHLPTQIGELQSLKRLNVRRNLLVELPNSLSRLKLHKLDFSSNRISEIPCDMHSMDTLLEMKLEHNPLTVPPAHLCTKGLVHIQKFLFIQALKENRKRGHFTDVQLRKNFRKSAVGHPLNTEGFRYNGLRDDQHKRHTADSGYSTTDSSDKMRWSPSENSDYDTQTMHTLSRAVLTLQGHPFFSASHSDLEEANNLALRAAESVKEQRQERELQRRHLQEPKRDQPAKAPVQKTPQAGSSPPATSTHGPREQTGRPSLQLQIQHQPRQPQMPESAAVTKSAPLPDVTSSASLHSPKETLSSSPANPSSGALADEFTRELQRQKSDYEARKRRAEQLRLERERAEDDARERDERRRAVMRVQEEQQAVLDRQREEARRKAGDRESVCSSLADSLSSSSPGAASSASDQDPSQPNSSRSRIPQSNSFREEKKTSQMPYRRTVSDTNYVRYPYSPQSPADRHPDHLTGSEEDLHRRDTGMLDRSPQTDSSPSTPNSHQEAPRVHYIPVIHDTSSASSQPSQQQDDEFRRRHEAMINQQRHEAQTIQRRLEAQKQNILRMQKDMWSTIPHNVSPKIEDSVDFGSYGRENAPNNSYNGSTLHNHQTNVLPPRCQKVLEALGPELNSMNPAFTIRRNLQHAQEEIQQIEKLRRTIESRLKVTLPENLPAALKDGVVLCHLANHIRPRSVSSIHVPSPAVPKLPMAKCRRNVENFLEACRKIGVEQEELFVPLDILEERGIADVAYTVHTLVDRAKETKLSAV